MSEEEGWRHLPKAVMDAQIQSEDEVIKSCKAATDSLLNARKYLLGLGFPDTHPVCLELDADAKKWSEASAARYSRRQAMIEATKRA